MQRIIDQLLFETKTRIYEVELNKPLSVTAQLKTQRIIVECLWYRRMVHQNCLRVLVHPRLSEKVHCSDSQLSLSFISAYICVHGYHILKYIYMRCIEVGDQPVYMRISICLAGLACAL